MTEPWRLIIDPPAAGVWNMAVDEAILSAVAEATAPPTVRLYQWNPPAVSLGYFQPAAEADGQLPARCDLVRRQTGGGAILHDAELTYSLCVPITHRLASPPDVLYRAVHEAIIAALSAVGVAAHLRGGSSSPALAAQRGPFFCFARHDANDIVCQATRGVAKIAGSAQRRTAKGVLQHGSILTGRDCEAAELIEALIGPLAEQLDADPRIADLSADEQTHAARLAETKYGNDAWTRRR